jgi:hypothetical protein
MRYLRVNLSFGLSGAPGRTAVQKAFPELPSFQRKGGSTSTALCWYSRRGDFCGSAHARIGGVLRRGRANGAHDEASWSDGFLSAPETRTFRFVKILIDFSLCCLRRDADLEIGGQPTNWRTFIHSCAALWVRFLLSAQRRACKTAALATIRKPHAKCLRQRRICTIT